MRSVQQFSLPGQLVQTHTVGVVTGRNSIGLLEQVCNTLPDLTEIDVGCRFDRSRPRSGAGPGTWDGAGAGMVHRLPRLVDC